MTLGDGDWQDRLEAIFRKYEAHPLPPHDHEVMPPITHDGETVHRCLLLKAMADRGNPRLTSPPKLTLLQGGKRD